MDEIENWGGREEGGVGEGEDCWGGGGGEGEALST